MINKELASVTGVIQAKWFKAVSTERPKDVVVVHSAELPNKPKAAKAVANFFSRLETPASAHLSIDSQETYRSVADNDVAYAAPGANHNGLHAELTAYAHYSRGEWEQPLMIAMLQRAADAVREWCDKYDIPKTYISAEQLKSGQRGITTHNDVSKAFRRSTHWDPGPGFPMNTFLVMVVDSPPPQATEDEMGAYGHEDCPSGGYWIFKRGDGGVFNYDGAPFFGSLPGLNVIPKGPIVAMEPYLVDGEVKGYWLLGADGGVYSFGEAPFTDSYAGHPEWHQGKRQFVDIEQHGEGYDLISVVVGSDPPERNVYDLSVTR